MTPTKGELFRPWYDGATEAVRNIHRIYTDPACRDLDHETRLARMLNDGPGMIAALSPDEFAHLLTHPHGPLRQWVITGQPITT